MQVSIAPPISSHSDLNSSLTQRGSGGEVEPLGEGGTRALTLLANTISTQIEHSTSSTSHAHEEDKMSDFTNISLQRLSEWLQHLEKVRGLGMILEDYQ